MFISSDSFLLLHEKYLIDFLMEGKNHRKEKRHKSPTLLGAYRVPGHNGTKHTTKNPKTPSYRIWSLSSQVETEKGTSFPSGRSVTGLT